MNEGDESLGCGAGQDKACARWEAAPADPAHFPAIRRALSAWAAGTGADAARVEAIALATYEALANVATHAYDSSGVVDVCAHAPTGSRVEVVVRDRGRWRPPSRTGTDAGTPGGRGLILIRSLADEVEVSAGERGTTVRMTWNLRA